MGSVITPGARGATGIPVTNAEGVSIAIGAPVYMSADNTVRRAKADAIATGRAVGLLMQALAAAASGGAQTVGPIALTTSQWDAICGTTGGLAFGVPYYLDPTVAGRLTPTPPSTVGQVVQKIITATSTTTALIDIGEPEVIGSASNLARLQNTSGGTMLACQPIYSNGAGTMSLGVADNSGKSVIEGLVVDASIANNAFGMVCTGGLMVATTAQWDAVAGTVGGLVFNTRYYLNKTTPGMLTSTPPTSPADDGKEVVLIVTALSTTLARISISAPELL